MLKNKIKTKKTFKLNLFQMKSCSVAQNGLEFAITRGLTSDFCLVLTGLAGLTRCSTVPPSWKKQYGGLVSPHPTLSPCSPSQLNCPGCCLKLSGGSSWGEPGICLRNDLRCSVACVILLGIELRYIRHQKTSAPVQQTPSLGGCLFSTLGFAS